jgi:protein-tyrosine phosphatase
MIEEQEMAELIEHTYLDSTAVQAFTTFRERRVFFSGAKNFRDLGGYQTVDGGHVRWGVLYRSDSLHKLTEGDLKRLSGLGLRWIVDFRSPKEKEAEPDRLPAGMASCLVEIPILDSSTQIFQDSRDEFIKNLKNIDPFHYMAVTNVELATRFTAEMQKFFDLLLSSNGQPILFHCAAGKDRTGFAAALILRILGIPHNVVMEDYLLSNKYFYAAQRWNLSLLRLIKGRQFADVVAGMARVHPSYLSAAFQSIYQEHGSFENYVQKGLMLTARDTDRLKAQYLE